MSVGFISNHWLKHWEFSLTNLGCRSQFWFMLFLGKRKWKFSSIGFAQSWWRIYCLDWWNDLFLFICRGWIHVGEETNAQWSNGKFPIMENIRYQFSIFSGTFNLGWMLERVQIRGGHSSRRHQTCGERRGIRQLKFFQFGQQIRWSLWSHYGARFTPFRQKS